MSTTMVYVYAMCGVAVFLVLVGFVALWVRKPNPKLLRVSKSTDNPTTVVFEEEVSTFINPAYELDDAFVGMEDMSSFMELNGVSLADPAQSQYLDIDPDPPSNLPLAETRHNPTFSNMGSDMEPAVEHQSKRWAEQSANQVQRSGTFKSNSRDNGHTYHRDTAPVLQSATGWFDVPSIPGQLDGHSEPHINNSQSESWITGEVML
jgi:hypothetical protein